MKLIGRLIRLAVGLAVLAGVLLVAGWFGANPGSVTIVWRGVRIDFSVTTAVLGLAGFAVTAVTLTWLFSLIIRAPHRFRTWRADRNREKALTTLALGFTAVAAGDARGAKAAARRIVSL